MRNKLRLNQYQPHYLRQKIKEFGIIQYDLADSLGISTSAISNFLKGIRPMPEHIESKITEILDGLEA